MNQRSIDFQKTLNAELIKAVKKDNWEEAKKYLELGADTETWTTGFFSLGVTPLTIAAEKGYGALVELLLEHDANPNGRGNKACTPLHEAIVNGHEGIAQVLFEAGADPYVKPSVGKSPIDYVRKKKKVKLLKLFETFGQEEPEKNEPPIEAPAPLEGDTVVINTDIGGRILQERFDFASRERISLVREGVEGPVETLTRQSFSEVVDQSPLRKAFATYKERGGQLTAEDVFPDARQDIIKLPPPKRRGQAG